MKNLRVVASLLLMAIIVASCGVAENGFGGSSIQKRKYTKGFYMNKNHSFKNAESEKLSDSDLPDSEAILNDEAEQTPVTEQTTAQTVVTNEAVVHHDQTTEKSQKPQENQKAPAKKKATVDTKSSKPATPARPRKEREHEYFIPVKQKANMNKKQSASSAGGGSDGMFILAVIFAILIPPIGVLIYTNIDWKKVLICLLLTILFFLPGMIYALLVVFDVI